MASSSNPLHLLPLLVSLAILLPFIRCDNSADLVISQCDKVVTNNQPNTTYADKMISDLLNFAPTNGFAYTYNAPVLYGLAWCRGDTSAQNCSTCLANAAKTLVHLCTNLAVAARIVFQDFCYLRLDTDDFLQTLDSKFGRVLRANADGQQIEGEHQAAYQASVEGLLKGLMKVIPQQKNKKFVKRKVDFGVEKLVIYGMGQCVQGVSKEFCGDCLGKTMEFMMQRCMYSKRCEIFLGGSCFLQYNAKNQITY